jgi:hypothetical protein
MAELIMVALHSPCTWLGVVWQKDIVFADAKVMQDMIFVDHRELVRIARGQC